MIIKTKDGWVPITCKYIPIEDKVNEAEAEPNYAAWSKTLKGGMHKTKSSPFRDGEYNDYNEQNDY